MVVCLFSRDRALLDRKCAQPEYEFRPRDTIAALWRLSCRVWCRRPATGIDSWSVLDRTGPLHRAVYRIRAWNRTPYRHRGGIGRFEICLGRDRMPALPRDRAFGRSVREGFPLDSEIRAFRGSGRGTASRQSGQRRSPAKRAYTTFTRFYRADLCGNTAHRYASSL